MKKSIIDSQESSNPEGLEQLKSSSSSDMKQIESLGSLDLKQSDSDDQVIESSSKNHHLQQPLRWLDLSHLNEN